jgi:hypothetical protein
LEGIGLPVNLELAIELLGVQRYRTIFMRNSGSHC